MPFKLILFDFDGTLADTADLALEIFNEISAKYKFRSINKEELKSLKGKSIKELSKYLDIPLYRVPSLLLKGQKLLYQRIKKVRPIENIVELLNNLKEKGFQLGILSTNSKDNIKVFLNQYDIELFDIIRTSASIWDKSRGLAKVIKKSKLDPEEVLYIGDEIRDIDASKKCGVPVASVTWGYNSLESLQIREPDFLVDQPEQLLPVITGI